MKTDYIQQFKERVGHWIDFYGMWEWEVYFKTKKMDSMAEVNCATPEKMVTIHINQNLGNICERQGEPQEEINTTAHHEVLEIMLDGLYNMALGRNFNTDEWESETHSVIHRIQRAQHSNIHDKKNDAKTK